MKKTILIALILIGGISILAAQHAQHKGCMQHEGKNFEKAPKMMNQKREALHLMMMKEELNLTEKQISELETNRMEFEKEKIELEAEIKILQMEHQSAMKDHDYKTAQTKMEKISDLKKQIAQKRIKLQEKEWNMLSKEQQEKADKLREEHRKEKMMQFKERKQAPCNK